MLLVLECGGGGSTKVKNLKRVRMKKIHRRCTTGVSCGVFFGGSNLTGTSDGDTAQRRRGAYSVQAKAFTAVFTAVDRKGL